MVGSSRRTFVLALILLLVTAAASGCMRRDRGDSGDDGEQNFDPEGADTLLVSLVGLDAPDGLDEVLANLTVDHLALYAQDRDEWVPLLASANTVDVLYTNGGDAAFLDEVPLVPGEYTAVELIVTQARITTEEGETAADVPQVACYGTVVLGAVGGGEAIELELWLSGADGIERTDTGWRYRPAIVGTVSDAAEGEAELTEPDCRPY